MAILLVTHDWGVVAASADRAFVMYAGHIVESGGGRRPVRPAAAPVHRRAAGAMPSRAEAGGRLAAIPGTVPEPAHWPPGCHFAPRCPLATAQCRSAPVAVFEPATGHRTRCLHHTELATGGNRASA